VRSRLEPHLEHLFNSIGRPPSALGTIVPPPRIRLDDTGETSSLQMGHEYFPMLHRFPISAPDSTNRRLYDYVLPGKLGYLRTTNGGNRPLAAFAGRPSFELASVIVMWSWIVWASDVEMPSLKNAKASRWPLAAWQ
jgi:hypothetical protein